MTFTDQFRNAPANFVSDLRLMVDLLQSLKASSTKKLSFPNGMEPKGYKCCCTMLGEKAVCKLAEIAKLRGRGCRGIKLLLNASKIKFHAWNEMPQGRRKCVVASQDPLLSQVE